MEAADVRLDAHQDDRFVFLRLEQLHHGRSAHRELKRESYRNLDTVELPCYRFLISDSFNFY